MSQKSSAKSVAPVSLLERIAWYALLAVPVAVPTAVSKIPFSGMPPFTYNLFVYPKLLAFGVLIGVALIAWIAGVITGAIGTRSVPLWTWLVAFLGLAGVSTVFALSPMTAFFGGSYHAVGMLVFLLGGALYLLITQLTKSSPRLRALTWSTVIGGVVVAAIGLLQIIGADPLGPSTGPGFMTARGASLLGNPDFAGTYLVLPAVLAAALALSETKKWAKALAAASFVLTAGALVATLTRGAWIGLVVGLIVLIVALVRSGAAKKVNWVYMGLGGAVALLLPLVLILRDPLRATRQIADLAAGSAAGSGRLMLWQEALAIVARHPFFGTGPDSYRLGWYAIRSAASVRLTGLGTLSEDPHNVVLLLLATIGIPAALAAVGLIGASLYTSATSALTRKPGQLTYSGWWAGLIALGAALVFATDTMPVIVAVFSSAAVLMAGKSKPREWPVLTRYALVTAASVLAVTALVVPSLSIAADATLMRGLGTPDPTGFAIRAASTAPWYWMAREKAVFGFSDQVQQLIGAGDTQGIAAAPVAEQRLQELAASNPAEYKYWAQLGSFLDNVAPVVGGDTYNRALAAGDRALQVYPISAEAAYLKATAQLGLGDPNAAVTTLAPIWQVDPTYPNAGVLYAEALLRAGDKAGASEVVRLLQTRFPSDEDVRAVAQRVSSAK